MASKKILIVDDNPDIIAILSQQLQGLGYETCSAKDGEEAVEMAMQERPNLIIMDVLMPKMTGYEALRRIRENGEMKRIPTIVISAKGVMKDFFSDLPFVEFIAKPYDMSDFTNRIRSLIAKADESGALKT